MGLTEGHWFEDEYSLSERQLERAIEDENDAYERGLRDGSAKTGWITTKFTSTFPITGDEVLLATSDRRVISGYYAGYIGTHHVWKSFRNEFVFWDNEITHWMPFPEPPKED